MDKQQRGITLVALVITIIVLLILAGVSMSLITGDGNLFNKAQEAGQRYTNEAQKEKTQIDELMNFVNMYMPTV